MDAVLRALVIYVAIMVIFRASGKRTLAQITTFDFVLLLIVGEATQQGLLGDDFSITNAVIVVSTLIGVDVGLTFVKEKAPRIGRAIDSLPLVVLQDGQVIEHRMRRARIEESDILSSGRASQGVERLDQIKYAVLEQGGTISVIPYPKA